MRKRLGILEKHNLKLQDIQAVIATMDPLENALAFLDWMREVSQVIIVSDTFVQFADPLMQKLKRPTLFCNTLKVAPDGQVVDYLLRQTDGKRKVVEGLQSMNFKVAAMGDSYNDITMLTTADRGFLFRPPANVVAEFPNFPVTSNYAELKPLVAKALKDFET
jgi:phosphoserine/homoserine phosphotransferase